MNRTYLALALELGAAELASLYEVYPVTQWTRQLSTFLIDVGFSLVDSVGTNDQTNIIQFVCACEHGPIIVTISNSPCRRVLECIREATAFDQDPFNLFGANDHLYERLGPLMGIVRNTPLSNEAVMEKWRDGILIAMNQPPMPRIMMYGIVNDGFGREHLMLMGPAREREILYQNVRERSGPGATVLHLRDEPDMVSNV